MKTVEELLEEIADIAGGYVGESVAKLARTALKILRQPNPNIFVELVEVPAKSLIVVKLPANCAIVRAAATQPGDIKS